MIVIVSLPSLSTLILLTLWSVPIVLVDTVRRQVEKHEKVLLHPFWIFYMAPFSAKLLTCAIVFV